MNKPNLAAFDAANYLLILVDREAVDSINHLRLQKLLYFTQGVSLALTGKILFKETIKALPYGPVVKSVFSQYKVFDNGTIPQPAEIDFSIYSEAAKAIIYKAYSLYGDALQRI